MYAGGWKVAARTLRTNCEQTLTCYAARRTQKTKEKKRWGKKNKTHFVLNLVVGKVRNCRSKVSNVVHAGILNLSIKEKKKKIASVLLLQGCVVSVCLSLSNILPDGCGGEKKMVSEN